VILRKGDRGAEVRALQERLAKLSYNPGPIDGILGDKTLSAVSNFELEHRLPASPAWTVAEATIRTLEMAPGWVRGIDVAKYQGAVDWAKVKASGVAFAVIKATESKGYVDPCFKKNWEGARAAGIMRGAYCFWHPQQDPKAQAEHFYETVGDLLPGDLPPTVDVERNDRLSPVTVNERLVVVCKEVAGIFGKTPILYTSARVCKEQGITVGGDCPVWLARYYARQGFRKEGPPLPPQWKRWSIWQTGYGDGLPGISGDVDRDFWQGTFEELQALCV
jgi:lysozyme